MASAAPATVTVRQPAESGSKFYRDTPGRQLFLHDGMSLLLLDWSSCANVNSEIKWRWVPSLTKIVQVDSERSAAAAAVTWAEQAILLSSHGGIMPYLFIARFLARCALKGARNSLPVSCSGPGRASRSPGSESAKDVKAARRFAELQRRAPKRAPRARKP